MARVLSLLLGDLLDQSVLLPVPVFEQGMDLLAGFVVPKQSGKFCMILHLKKLKCFIV